MKFLADVNIPHSFINELRDRGHDVRDAKEGLLMAKDVELITLAKKEKRIILTRDKDFIVLVQYPKYHVPTIVIRLPDQKPKIMLQYLLDLLRNQHEGVLIKSLTIIRTDAAHSHVY